MKTPATMSSLSGLLPLYFPRALGGLDDRLRARRLVRGFGPCDIAVFPRRSRLQAGLLVFELHRGAQDVVVKHPRDGFAAAVTVREQDILRRLDADRRLDPWRHVLPRVVGSTGPSGAFAQQILTGVPAERAIRNSPHDPYAAAAPALRLLADLRAATGRRRPAAERALPWWQSQLTELAEAIPRYRYGRRSAEFEALRRLLDTALTGATLTEGWTHGDYHPGNVLLGGQPVRVTGVFDWSNGHPDGPCEIDAYTFVLGLRQILTGRSLGGLVAEAVRAGRVPDEDRALLELAGVGTDHEAGDPLALPLLTWLWHVASNLRKSPRFAHSHWWLTDTVTPVLRESARRAGARR
jgi:hypothetical protein